MKITRRFSGQLSLRGDGWMEYSYDSISIFHIISFIEEPSGLVEKVNHFPLK